MSNYNENMYEGIDYVPGDYDKEYQFEADITITCYGNDLHEVITDISNNDNIRSYEIANINPQTHEHIINITYQGSIFIEDYENITESHIIKAIDIDGFKLIDYWID
jgi:hypothetical protein